ncbi:tetratricopeptide repeat protein [Candidatus Sumerlaeota bacterium]|nr:tetratricopeptide repeat protein [Candidatus Sumerlaeota bacterium]
MKILRSAFPMLTVLFALACDGESSVTEVPDTPTQPEAVDTLSSPLASPEITALNLSDVSAEVGSGEMAQGESSAPTVDVPLALHVYSNRTQYVLGEPVQLFVEFRNLTDREVQTRAILFLDHGLSVHITRLGGERWRFIDRLHTGITVPTAGPIHAHDSWGFHQFLAHSDVGEGRLPFPEPGMYRIDVGATIEIEGAGNFEHLLAEPVAIEVIEPVREDDRTVYDIFLQPNVARAIQQLGGDEQIKDAMMQVLEIAPESVFAEHAHYLLGTMLMIQGNYLQANEHFYEVYERVPGFYMKEMVLLNILTCFHWADEPERALRVCEALLEINPRMANRQNPLLQIYLRRLGDGSQS